MKGSFRVVLKALINKEPPGTNETQYTGLQGYTIKVRPTRIYHSGLSGPLKDQAKMGDTWSRGMRERICKSW